MEKFKNKYIFLAFWRHKVTFLGAFWCERRTEFELRALWGKEANKKSAINLIVI